MSEPMEEKFRSEMRDYAWKYFALHSEQRIQTFNFFLVICTLIIGGLIALLKDSKDYRVGAPVAFGLTFISFIFWKLDVRNTELIHHSEEALKLLENDSRLATEAGVPHRLKIFSHEDYVTNQRRKKKMLLGLIPWHFSYSTCFKAVFLVVGISGFVAGIALLVS